jgi:uncharacterized protein with von Willebrand factor type A (vWA) domain
MQTTSQTSGQGQSVVEHDRFDSQAFSDTRAQFAALDEVAGTRAMPEAEAFTEDLFMSFYKAAPQLAPEESLSLTAQFRRRLMHEIMSTAEYARVRGLGTTADQYSSGMATASTAYKVIEKLDGKTQQQLQEMQQAEAAAQELLNAAQALHNFAEQAEGDEAEQMEAEAQDLEQQAEALQAKAEAAAAALEAKSEQIEDQARRAAREALSEAGEEIAETNDAIAAYGGYSYEQSMPTQRMNTTEKMKLARQIKDTPKLAKIAELAGRMVNTALQKQKTKVIHPPDEIVGITQGDDLARVLPSETLLLDDPVTEPLFYQKFIERELMQYDMIGHEQQARGPIICCVDLSGSMDGLHINPRRLRKISQDQSAEAAAEYMRKSYTKEVWAKAVLLALLAIAQRQHRDFAVVYFSSYGEIKTYTFPKAAATTAQLLDLATFFYGGGTTFDGWMIEALKIAERGPFQEADVITISDGEVFISDESRDEYNARRQAREMHAYGVLLETNRQAGEIMESITDHYITVTDLGNDGKALDMLFTI